MARAYSVTQKHVDTLAVAGAGIYKGGGHIGLLHRDGPTVKFLHLCDHHVLKNDAQLPSGVSVWIDPDVDPMILVTVATWCRLIYSLHGNGTMPYGFSSPESFFDDDGQIRDGAVGLTCATMALAIFQQAGIRLIDYGSWPNLNRADRRDRVNFSQMIKARDPLQFEKLESDATKSRYKPLHVAGAILAKENKRPVSFRSAIQLGGIVRKML
jgi:hypothetical protein